jgi:hypothetical protein
MATRDPPGAGWTVLLGRPPARIVEGWPEDGYTDAFKVICCDCGDHLDLDFSEVSPGLRQVRGPYPIADGISGYVEHAGLHRRSACRQLGTRTDAG